MVNLCTCQKGKLFNSVLQVSGSWIESLVRHSWRLCLSSLLDAQDRHILTQFDRVLLDVRSFALRRLFPSRLLRVLTSISGAYWSNQSPCAHYFIIHFIGLCTSNCTSFKQFCGATASTLHVKFTYSCLHNCSFTCSTCTPRPTLLGGMRRSSRQSIPSNKKLEGCDSTALLDARIGLNR